MIYRYCPQCGREHSQATTAGGCPPVVGNITFGPKITRAATPEEIAKQREGFARNVPGPRHAKPSGTYYGPDKSAEHKAEIDRRDEIIRRLSEALEHRLNPPAGHIWCRGQGKVRREGSETARTVGEAYMPCPTCHEHAALIAEARKVKP